ncbi:MAG: aspartate kinase, partial [Anaerolineae bacterium]
MALLAFKFGGTSVGSAEAVAQVAGIVLDQVERGNRLVVVVSAMSGVTDLLTRGALGAAGGDDQAYLALVTDLRARHYGVVDALLDADGERARLLATVDRYLDEFGAFCRSVHVLGEVTPRAMDAITSLGERINARILAAVLRQRGAGAQAVDATELIVTDDTFQDAVPRMEASRESASARLGPLLAEGVVPVVTGFIGATAQGVTTTLGRGGSDFSAAILGDCLDADEVWIWTDVDGVMSADPRLVLDARVIPVLSYAEVGELAYFGAKVLHPRTIRPVVERGIPLWVKN